MTEVFDVLPYCVPKDVLNLVVVLILACGVMAAVPSSAEDRVDWVTGTALDQQLTTPIDILWADLSFRQAIESVSRARRVAVILDRRVDPSQKVNLAITDMPLQAALKAVAQRRRLDAARLASVIYIGPTDACQRLHAVAAELSRELRQFPSEIKRRSLRPQGVSWDELTTPRELLELLPRTAGLGVQGLDRVPHDLWAAGNLPAMPLAERLTLIAIQYNLTFRAAGDAQLEVVPLPAVAAMSQPETATASPPPRAVKEPKPRAPVGIEKLRIDRLAVQEKPLKAVLQQLAERLQLDLRWDEKGIEAAGISLDQRISLQIQDATVDELLTGLLKGTGLTYHRRQRVVEIGLAGDSAR